MYTNYFTLYFKFTIIKISSRNPHIFAIFPFNAEQQGKTALPIKFSISASQLQRLERSRATTAETKNMFWPYFILLPTSPFGTYIHMYLYLLTFHYEELTLKTTLHFRWWLEILDFCFAYARNKNNNNIWIRARVHNLR